MRTRHHVCADVSSIGNLRERLLADDMIVDGVHYINEAYNSGKRIITEGSCLLPRMWLLRV